MLTRSAVTELWSFAQVTVIFPQFTVVFSISARIFVCLENAGFLKTAVYVVSPISSDVASLVTSDVVVTVSSSVWAGSLAHTRVAVTSEPSSAQLYVGAPQVCPVAGRTTVVVGAPYS